MSFRVIIPARWAATRFPGKPLALLAGKPMVQHVHAIAIASGAEQVIVATDDVRIRAACESFGAEVEMTAAGHSSGTDRLAEVARRRRFRASDILVNVQGDEPLLPPALVAQAAGLLAGEPRADIATLATPVQSLAEYLDPNVVKVVATAAGQALYFSRAPIPWHRDGAPAGLASQRVWGGALRHLGLYAYRAAALLELAALPPSPLEQAERLEQLRALQAGLRIWVAVAESGAGPGVDTPEDLERAERLLGQTAAP